MRKKRGTCSTAGILTNINQGHYGTILLTLLSSGGIIIAILSCFKIHQLRQQYMQKEIKKVGNSFLS
jgi:hypothetical protein